MDDDLSFLDVYNDGGANNAILKAVLPNGHVLLVSECINMFKFLDHCPLLYHTFEYGFRGLPQASIDAPSVSSVISLVRYCYTGNYLAASAEYAPISLLQHVEIYKLAVDFDIFELRQLAHGNFSCQADFACCLPDPPQDLLEAIHFVYEHYADQDDHHQHGLVSTLRNYCIATFLYHRLGENAEFVQVVRDVPAFRQDLCRTNMERNFEDDCAFAIVRMAIDTPKAPSGIRPTVLASRALPDEMLYDMPPEPALESQHDVLMAGLTGLFNQGLGNNTFDAVTTMTSNVHDVPPPNVSNISATMTLPLRSRTPRLVLEVHSDSDLSSDDDGFTMVHRPRVAAAPTPEEPMSSPELIPSVPIDVLAATGSDYPSEDEWSMI